MISDMKKSFDRKEPSFAHHYKKYTVLAFLPFSECHE